MPKFITKTASLFVRDREVAGLSYSFDTQAERPEEECTTYGTASGWREYLAGLPTWSPMVELYQDTPDPEKQFWEAMVNGPAIPWGWTLTRPPVAGDLCYFGQTFVRSHQQKRPVGKIEGLSVGLKGDSPLLRGQVLEVADALGTGNSAALNFGAVASGERLFWAVWITAFAGTSPTLDLVLQSDDAGGFGSPTARVTSPAIAQFTSVNNGWYFGWIDGPITDTHWRIARTVGGSSTPTWTYRSAIGRAVNLG